MKSIERRFLSLEKSRPHHSSLLNFATTVKQLKISDQSLQRWFNRLVSPEDFERSDKRHILDYLRTLNRPEEHQNQPQNGH